MTADKELDVRGEICKIISRMLDNPNKYGIYPTTRCYDELETFIAKLLSRASAPVQGVDHPTGEGPETFPGIFQ